MQKNTNVFLHLVVAMSFIFATSACTSGSDSGGTSSTGSSSSGSASSSDDAMNLAAVCPTIIPLNAGMNIKYKSQNVHGGRGPSFLLGCEADSKQYWPAHTYLAKFSIFSAKGNEIGKFVNFDPGDYPYGNRSYTGLPGGYPGDSETLLNSAMADGSPEIYINVKGGICFKVDNPTVDQGTLNPVTGKTGHC